VGGEDSSFPFALFPFSPGLLVCDRVGWRQGVLRNLVFAKNQVSAGRTKLVGSGFCNGFNGWVVGVRSGWLATGGFKKPGFLAADFETDVADGLLVGDGGWLATGGFWWVTGLKKTTN
jgi:hypothetical protein